MADPVRLRLDEQISPLMPGSCDIFELPSSGDILAAWNRGDAADNGSSGVVGKIAYDRDGLKWPPDEPFKILTLDSEQKIDSLTVSVRNPTLLRLKNGKVGLIYLATRHAQKIDLQILESWGDGSGVPTSGQNLVIVGIDNNDLLHIRIFDAGGKLATDGDETNLPWEAHDAIKTLKQQIPGLRPPHVPTNDEEWQVIGEAKSIVGQTLPQLSDLFIRTLEHDRSPEAINWSYRIGITEKSRRGKGLYGLTHSAAAVLADGTLLVTPWYQQDDQHGSEGILVFTSPPNSNGDTWIETDTRELCLPLPKDANGNEVNDPPTEAKVTQLWDGRVLMSIRPTCNKAGTARAVYLSYSKDGNEFSLPEARPELPSPSAPNVVRRLPGPSDDLIVVWNNCVPCFPTRGDETSTLPRNWLSSALSKDCGKTWVNHKVIDSGFDDQGQLLEIAYPSCTFIRNKAYISYYKTSMNPIAGTTPTSLELVVVPPEWFYER